MPVLSRIEQRDKQVRFDQSEERKKALEKLEKKLEKANSLSVVEIPDVLTDWVTVETKGEEVKLKVETNRTEVERFEDDKKRVRSFTSFERDFTDYFHQYLTTIRINQLYEALHTLYYELKGRENKQLYLSFGLVSGRIGGETYQNFLFHIPLKLSLRAQTLRIDFDTFVNRIVAEQHFTELFGEHFRREPQTIEQRKTEVLTSVDSFNTGTRTFYFNPDFIELEFFEPALRMLSVFSNLKYHFFTKKAGTLELNFDFFHKIDAEQLWFSFSPVIQTKIVESQIIVSKDASNIVQQINRLEGENELDAIPDFFKKLFSTQAQSNIQLPDLPASLTERGHDLSPHQFLFPLPYNQEQREIADRLLDQDAVTVKGTARHGQKPHHCQPDLPLCCQRKIGVGGVTQCQGVERDQGKTARRNSAANHFAGQRYEEQ